MKKSSDYKFGGSFGGGDGGSSIRSSNQLTHTNARIFDLMLIRFFG